MKKETDPMDDFFRESLKNFTVEPSAPARARFLKGASSQAGWSSLLRWQNILLFSGLLVAVAVLLYLGTTLLRDDAAVTTPAAVVVKTPGKTIPNIPGQHKQANEVASAARPGEAPATVQAIAAAAVVPVEKPSFQPFIRKEQSIPAQSGPAVTTSMIPAAVDIPVKANENAAGNDNLVTTPVVQQEQPVQAETPSDIERKAGNPAVAAEEEQSTALTPGKNNQPGALKPISRWQWERYLRYDLDVKVNESPGRIHHSLLFETRFRKGRFVLSAAAGMELSNGRQLYRVEYNEYLGTYKKLDSITFEWDRDHYHLLPAYHSTPTEVYDTLLKNDSYSVRKQYRKIRIPVSIGYRVFESGNFSLDVGTGLEFNLYSSSKESDGTYSPGANKLVRISAEQDAYTKNYFFWLADVAVAYRFNERFTFQLDPTLKYLLNPGKAGQIKQFDPILRGSLLIRF